MKEFVSVVNHGKIYDSVRLIRVIYVNITGFELKIADDEGVSPSSSVITRVSCNML
jgi:hypothetical protein